MARTTNRGAEQSSGDRAAAAAYLATITADLTAMAKRHDFDALTYILDMARLEAESTMQRLKDA